MTQTIIGGVITGVFLVIVAVVGAVFNRAKNAADVGSSIGDAGSSIADGAKIIVDMTLGQLKREEDKVTALRGKLNRVRAYARDLFDRLVHLDDQPPPYPSAMYDEDGEE